MKHSKTALTCLVLLIFNLTTSAQDFLQWTKKIGGNSDNDYAYCIRKDVFGNLYILGGFSGTVDFDPNSGIYNVTAQGNRDVFLLKLDNNSNFIWVKTFGGNISSLIFANLNGIRFDLNNDIYISGYFNNIIDTDPSSSITNILTSGTSNDQFLIKLDLNGNFIWSKKFSNRGSVGIDNSNNVIISGYFESITDMNPNAGVYNLTPIGYRDGYIIKLDSQGNFLFAKQFGGLNVQIVNTQITEFDNSNNIYLSGNFGGGTVDFNPDSGIYNLTSSTSSVLDSYILKLDSNCNFIWVKQIVCSYFCGIVKLSVDDISNIYYTIEIQGGTVDLDPGPGNFLVTCLGSWDFAISKMDSNGNFIWGKHIGGNGAVSASDFDMDINKNLILCGVIVYDSVDIDPGIGVVTINPTGDFDGFVLRIDSNGNYLSSKHFKSSTSAIPTSILSDNQNLYICGGFTDTVDFDPSILVNNVVSDSGDAFILKLSDYPLLGNNIIKDLNCIYPNPAGPYLIVDNPNLEIKRLKIFTSSGQCIFSTEENIDRRIEINLEKYNCGVYYLQTTDFNQIQSTQKFIKE